MGGFGAKAAVASGTGVLICSAVACAALAAMSGTTVGAQAGPVEGIPSEYLAAYRESAARFELGDDGWSYLAGIGKVESDHGRSTAPGVRNGQNFHGCCAGPMQIHNGFGSGGGTWGQFKVDGDGDGRLDVYDAEDAVATAARYLRASGAPASWPRALFAYNHAGWYVERVSREAAAYMRAAAVPAPVAPVRAQPGSGWLATVPGFPSERCDRRIVPEVMALVRAYGLTLSDCYGGDHAIGGEHPLGLAVDVSPRDGDWRRTETLARAAGWRPACGATGCPDAGPFRVVLYNGFPGHGDPRYTTRPHLHLSWNHAPAEPFTQAAWVRPVLSATAPRPR